MLDIKNISQRIIKGERTLLQALNQLNVNAGGVLVVTDPSNKLLGTVTDGDIRRALLNGKDLQAPVSGAMQARPLSVLADTEPHERLAFMLARGITFLPVVDDEGKLLGAELHDKVQRHGARPNYAVIMCGGLGTRLGALTRNCPKPMLRIGGVPILERIMKGVVAHGITKFFFATNYLREQIEEYFGNGEKWNVETQYLRETKRLGTAGALSLLPFRPEAPLLIMNGDILTDANFSKMMDFHSASRAIATMGIVEFRYQNPYGVIRYDATNLVGIEEKPVQSSFINSGIYVIEPELLESLPQNEFIDMPTILLNSLKENRQVKVYPIRENWLDIGREDDFKLAQTLF